MGPMTRRQILQRMELPRVEEALRAAERRSSGEIRVSLVPFFWGDVRRAAERAFHRLGMTATRERNGVLIFVVPARRRFAIIGDEGIHARVGQDFWEHVSRLLARHFQAGDFTTGLVEGIREIGERLAVHFPSAGPRDENELPDEVDLGQPV
ncbi:MAG TPA: TPM domain-containing protein [Archangium sp.]|uniref:TPM domain-containing protein n=1 Tax=Archangium sp. TaxID=1872627 RepID=UPI002E2F4617|nr:TPM domain-containing protein [Archangium sp.]HEX5752121.1 TPM domain-containing protein [Archangium sp.]